MEPLYRIQDADGRGPFKPGFSHKWLDANRSYSPPAIYEEFGWPMIDKMRRSGLFCGSACRSPETLGRWFSRAERRRLKRMGYSVVSVRPDVIFAESDHQVVFGCENPLNQICEGG